MKTTSAPLSMLVFVILGFLLSCNPTDPVNNEDPRDLNLEVQVAEDGSGLVTIQASAINATLYQLFIDSNEDPNAENKTGHFEYTFVRSGIYQITVRAYGLSGRYLNESRQVQVNLDTEISLNDGYLSPLSYEGYDLVWNDEFEGTSVKSENWIFELGTGCPNCGWGNNELQYYRKENATVENGVLKIEAKHEKFGGMDYTSARLITKGLRSFTYGRIDIRALLPKGQGLWPALWMLGDNFQSEGWPACGEIDIMEMVGGMGKDHTTHGTIHWSDNGNHASTGKSYSLSTGILADEYHVFSIIWNESSITWLLNDQDFYTVNLTPVNMSAFHNSFFFIMNVAVGGNWPGSPDSSTVFPQKMNVDYLRVFQKQN